MLRNSATKRNVISISLVLLVLGAMTLALKPRAAHADERHGDLHLTKNCSTYTGAAGSFCTFTSSNIPEVTVGSKVYYTQAAVVSAAPGDEGVNISLDTNIVLFVGDNDWATGRCTLDTIGFDSGLCTISDGTGALTGFHARVLVSSTDGVNYTWAGTYSFSHGNLELRDRDND
jgi:hypothetical protein